MTTPSPGEALVSVRAVTDVIALIAQYAPNESHCRVQNEYAAQYEKNGHCDGILASGQQCETSNGVAEVAAARVSHEHPGRRPIPGEKAQAGGADHESGRGD